MNHTELSDYKWVRLLWWVSGDITEPTSSTNCKLNYYGPLGLVSYCEMEISAFLMVPVDCLLMFKCWINCNNWLIVTFSRVDKGF